MNFNRLFSSWVTWDIKSKIKTEIEIIGLKRFFYKFDNICRSNTYERKILSGYYLDKTTSQDRYVLSLEGKNRRRETKAK